MNFWSSCVLQPSGSWSSWRWTGCHFCGNIILRPHTSCFMQDFSVAAIAYFLIVWNAHRTAKLGTVRIVKRCILSHGRHKLYSVDIRHKSCECHRTLVYLNLCTSTYQSVSESLGILKVDRVVKTTARSTSEGLADVQGTVRKWFCEEMHFEPTMVCR